MINEDYLDKFEYVSSLGSAETTKNNKKPLLVGTAFVIATITLFKLYQHGYFNSILLKLNSVLHRECDQHANHHDVKQSDKATQTAELEQVERTTQTSATTTTDAATSATTSITSTTSTTNQGTTLSDDDTNRNTLASNSSLFAAPKAIDTTPAARGWKLPWPFH